MKNTIFLLCAIAFLSVDCQAQFGKVRDTEYYMSFEPVVGSLKGTSDITDGVNPNLTLQSQGLLYGIDWVSARWAEVEGGYLVPKLQIPIRIRNMRGKDNKGLKTSDGTYFPEEERSDPDDKPWAPFTYFDCSFDAYISPYYFKAGPIIITPKFGFGLDLAKHDYNIDLSKFIGKEGTDPGLESYINDSYSPFYTYTFWEDLYGINLGTYVNVGKRILVDAGWEYYPGRLITKAVGNTINSNWDGYAGISAAKSAKLSRFTIEGQYRVISWFSIFVKYEHSNYQFDGPIVYSGDQPFYQKYSNVLFGITLGGPR